MRWYHQHWLQQNQITALGWGFGLKKGTEDLHVQLAFLIVPPTMLQAFFPCNVAKKNSIQPECASQFDEISGLLKFWSSYIVLLSHRWNKVFVQKWKLVSDVVFIKVFQKTVHHNCVMGLVVTYAHIRFMGKLTTAIHILYHERVYVTYELF